MSTDDFLPARMPDIPRPAVLDPDRLVMPERDNMTVDEHRSQTQAALRELARTCEYGEALRAELQGVREYLSTHHPDSAGDPDWEVWRTVYGSVVSSLAGPRGDSGLGFEEATRIAQEHGSFGDRRG